MRLAVAEQRPVDGAILQMDQAIEPVDIIFIAWWKNSVRALWRKLDSKGNYDFGEYQSFCHGDTIDTEATDAAAGNSQDQACESGWLIGISKLILHEIIWFSAWCSQVSIVIKPRSVDQ